MMLLLAILLAATTAGATEPQVWDRSIRYRVGDDPSWSNPALDDSKWTRATFETLPEVNDALWVRLTFDLREFKVKAGHPFGIYVGGMFSHEVWWDGVKIGSGGTVGRTKAAEVPGPIESHFHVPDALIAPGIHTVAMRMSAFHRGFSPLHGYWGIIGLGNYDRVVEMRTSTANIAVAALSGIALTAVFAFAMYWLTRRDRNFLLLGFLCLGAGGLLMAEAWRPLIGYTYDWHLVRLRCVVALSWLTGVLLVAVVASRFPIRFGRWILAATALTALIIPLFPRGWDPKSGYIFALCLSVASAWTLWAAIKRMHGSVLALIGVGGATAAFWQNPYAWVDSRLYFALLFVFVCLLCSHALEVRREQQEKTEAVLRSARLEVEMLKRQLQPHFLMNTLTALSEWIEQEPKTAVRMIDSLSDELRILGEMSMSKMVSADDELRLCRSHLANMSLRKDVAYNLEVQGVDGKRLVPPAMFHTLVENAVTHGASAERVTLRLSASRSGSKVRYVFEAPAGEESNGSVGTGTKYIEARLREAWGEAWSFRQGRAGSCWRAEIEVPA